MKHRPRSSGKFIIFDADWDAPFLRYRDIRKGDDLILINDCFFANGSYFNDLFQSSAVEQQCARRLKSIRYLLPIMFEDFGFGIALGV